MLILFQSSPVTVPLWVLIAEAIILVSGTWFATFVNRKRQSSVRAEEDKLNAEARNLDIQSLGELHTQLRETRSELAEIVQEQRVRAEENRRTHGFLRDQVLWNEQVTTLARQAAHAAINEIQRCVVAIRLRDDVITEARVAIQCIEDQLTENKIRFVKANLREVPSFEQKEHEEIVKYQAFPLPPKGPGPQQV